MPTLVRTRISARPRNMCVWESMTQVWVRGSGFRVQGSRSGSQFWFSVLVLVLVPASKQVMARLDALPILFVVTGIVIAAAPQDAEDLLVNDPRPMAGAVQMVEQ